jgi:DNA-binding GntR family transcriptional regulator
MAFTPSENLPEQLAREISDKIIHNELKPGERVIEARLADEMGVSRSPMREALRILEKQKLVALTPRKGARVTSISAAHIEWYYDIFEALYSLVARRAAENATAKDRGDMQAALRQIETAAADHDIDAYYEGIFAFAASGLKAAQNPLLETLLRDLGPANRRIQYASLSSRANDLQHNVRFFQEMYQHIAAGQPSRVEAAARAYARNEKIFALKIANGHKPREDAP